MEVDTSKSGLPENAYRELNSGEKYIPIVPHSKIINEVTLRSLVWGVIMAVIFSAASAFLGLKVAQVIEVAIPISILAVGIGNFLPRKSTILENVIIQSIGQVSGGIVAGAIFTLPALFIFKGRGVFATDISFVQIVVTVMLGSALGICLMIPFRRYFVSEMHGKYPFPEGTAITEVLVAGERGGKDVIVLLWAMLFGGVYDFLVHQFGLWRETLTSRLIPVAGDFLAEKAKLVLRLNVLAAVTGLGYIVGMKYALIICAGSFLSWFVIIPLMAHLPAITSLLVPQTILADPTTLVAMSPEKIFAQYVRLIGIGGIAVAGIIGIWKSRQVLVQAITVGLKDMLFKGEQTKESEAKGSLRTDRDMKMSTIFIIIAAILLAAFFFFRFSILSHPSVTGNPWLLAIISVVVAFGISFLFTAVAAQAIAIVGINPVSGMTLMTLILASIILALAGLTGPYGIMAGLLIGGVVCTALAVAGAYITDLKIGYWIGSTPYNQQVYKFIGAIVASVSVAVVIIVLNKVYGFDQSLNPNALPSPQANAMAAVIEPIMTKGAAIPWGLYILGIIIAFVVNFLKISPLAFALGMYIPLGLNTPILLGAIIALLVRKSAKGNESLAKERHNRGVLTASGFIAAGALFGVLSAFLKVFETSGWVQTNAAWFSNFLAKTHIGQNLHWEAHPLSELASLVAIAILCAFMYWYSTKPTKNN